MSSQHPPITTNSRLFRSSANSSSRAKVDFLQNRLDILKHVRSFLRTRLTCDAIRHYIDQRLGSGKYGSVYKIKGRDPGFIELSKMFGDLGIAIKPLRLTGPTVPPTNVRDNHVNVPKPLVELFMLMLMSEITEKGQFPHFPLVYSVSLCGTSSGVNNNFRSLAHGRGKPDIALVFTELARGDLATWLGNSRHSNEAISSAIFQCVMALFAFKTLGFTHNDAHAGNFLYHSVPPGGYWHYKLSGKDIYVKNCGHQFVLWDPMFASVAKPSVVNNNGDFWRLSQAIVHLLGYNRHAVKILDTFLNRGVKLPDTFFDWIKHLDQASLDEIRVGNDRAPARQQILNRKPYRVYSNPFAQNNGTANKAFARLLQVYSGA